MINLKGLSAVVTGAGKGIGRATARALASEGVNVVLVSRTRSDLESAAAEISTLDSKARSLIVTADVSQSDDVERLTVIAHREFQQIDILVNNAGVGRNGSVKTLTTQDYDWIMNSNMRSTWLCTKAFMPRMLERRKGSIVFVSSVAGLAGLPNDPIYCATKFAQVGFAQALDYEAYPKNVKITVIAPGGTNTNYGFYNGTRTPNDPDLEGFLDADDVASAVVFACKQPLKTRVFLIGMRPMNEALGAGSSQAAT